MTETKNGAEQEIKEKVANDADSAAEIKNETGAEEPQAVELSAEDLQKMLDSVTVLVSQKEEAEQKLLRMQADFDNFRRRSRQEKEDIIKNANKELLMTLLPVLDNFERALENKDNSSFAQGVDMIYRQLIMLLEQKGLTKIEALDAEFDPAFHEALMQDEVDEDHKGKVTAVIQTGYLLNGVLLRPAGVKVGI